MVFKSFVWGAISRSSAVKFCLISAVVVAVGNHTLLAGASESVCPTEFVCIPRSLSPAEVADLEEWQKDLGVVAFTVPQASAIAQSLIKADTQAALDKIQSRGFGWTAEFGYHADTTDGVNGMFASVGPRFTWKGLSLFVRGEAWGKDGAFRGGLRVEF